MKKILFAMAMLANSLVPAHAEPLPRDYFGLWCFEGKDQYSDSSFWYNGKCPGTWINIKRNGYEFRHEHEPDVINCKYVSVKHADPVIIRVVARCTSDEGTTWKETLRLSLNRVRELTIVRED
jgi:hypothetical protein